jgi:hypothetical protein
MVWNRKENRKAASSTAQQHDTAQVVMVYDGDGVEKGGDSVALSIEASDDLKKYESHPLVQSMIRCEQTRNAEMEEEGKNQILYVKSNDGWIPSLFMIRGRALDWIWFPWVFESYMQSSTQSCKRQ